MDKPWGNSGMGDKRVDGKAVTWPGWKNIPMRKPLAFGIVLYSGILLLGYSICGIDVPPGIAGLLQTLIYTCVGGYAATSAYEAVRTQGEGVGIKCHEEKPDTK